MKKFCAIILLLTITLSVILHVTACGFADKNGQIETLAEGNFITPTEFTFTDEIQQLSHQALNLPVSTSFPCLGLPAFDFMPGLL